MIARAVASAAPSKATKLLETCTSRCMQWTFLCSASCSRHSERLTRATRFTTCHLEPRFLVDICSRLLVSLLPHDLLGTGQLNPLDAYVWNSSGPVGVKEYYIKVVPVTYTNLKGAKLSSNQYSVTEHFKHSYDGFPAVYILCAARSSNTTRAQFAIAIVSL